jgi:hypothetical protein
VAQRRGGDARVDRAEQVHRRVVDQHLDPDLAAARELVGGAVQIVVRQPDALQPAGGGRVRAVVAVGGDVDEMPGLVPGPYDLDGTRIGLGGEDLLVAVRLGDAGLDLLGSQAVDLQVCPW